MHAAIYNRKSLMPSNKLNADLGVVSTLKGKQKKGVSIYCSTNFRVNKVNWNLQNFSKPAIKHNTFQRKKHARKTCRKQ